MAKIRAIVKRTDEPVGHVCNVSNTLKNLQKLVDGNIGDFLEVTDPATLINLLKEIQTGAAAIDNSNPDIQNLIKQLQDSTAETILRIETAQ